MFKFLIGVLFGWLLFSEYNLSNEEKQFNLELKKESCKYKVNENKNYFNISGNIMNGIIIKKYVESDYCTYSFKNKDSSKNYNVDGNQIILDDIKVKD